MGRVIAVISGKDGVGKTTVAATLSSCFATLNKKTLCLYFGTGSHHMKFALGITDSVYAGSIDVLKEQGGVMKACTKHSGTPNLYILSLSDYIEPGKLTDSDVKLMFSEIHKNFDYCIIDTPSISDAGIKPAISGADMTIIVTTCDTPTITDVLIAARYSLESGIKDYRLIINRIHPENNEKIKETADKICNTVNTKLKGLIPEDELISQIPLSKSPKVLHSKRIFKSRFLSIARGIISEEGSLAEHKSTSPLPKKPPRPPQLPLSMLQTYERPQMSENDVPFEIPSNFLGKFGDPTRWAQSTLKHANKEDLIAIHSIQANPFTGGDTIRDRMWLHDLLDDKSIPYYIEVGSKDGTKDLAEAQIIYVERKNAEQALFYLGQFNDPGNIVREDISKDSKPILSTDGVPQKKCTLCGKDIDFDYHKCPYCKGIAD